MIPSKLSPILIRQLDVVRVDNTNSFIAAASGLARFGNQLYVVADDSLHLAAFTDGDLLPGQLLTLLPGTLPDRPKARKKVKPDFESLVPLPRFGSFPFGALLALGSGSKETRERAVLVGLTETSGLSGEVQVIDFAPFFTALKTHLGQPNIEGGAIWRDQLCLLHRGNKSGANVMIRLPIGPFIDSLRNNQSPYVGDAVTFKTIDLGAIDGVPLCWTDAKVLNDHLIISAAAENTDNSIDDGPCKGSMLATLNWDGELLSRYPLEGNDKIEGIAVAQIGKQIQVDMVTDNDDPDSPALLLLAYI